tara:strand:+ start:190 stop:492 length:303 start_codon:yes stop_codon:yes gene_type:complete
MPSRSALRVIKRTFDNDDEVIARNRDAVYGGVSEEEAVMGAYRTLAEEMGATLEVTLDGQVVIYTGYFKPSLPVYVNLYEPGYIEARDLTPEEEAALEAK